MSTSRVNIGDAAPNILSTVVTLDREAKAFAAEAGVDEALVALIEIRASQINKCAFCLRMHTQAARKAGVSADKIAVLPAWRETGYFTTGERAALALAEAVTSVSDGQVPDEVYNESATYLTREQIAAVEWMTVVINAWNRIAIASRYDVSQQ